MIKKINSKKTRSEFMYGMKRAEGRKGMVERAEGRKGMVKRAEGRKGWLKRTERRTISGAGRSAPLFWSSWNTANNKFMFVISNPKGTHL
jgi:hypothetical protein